MHKSPQRQTGHTLSRSQAETKGLFSDTVHSMFLEGGQGAGRDVLSPGGGGVGTRPRYLIVCLWRRLLASRHCTFRPSVGLNVVLVVSTEPLDDLSCLTTPGSAIRLSQRRAVAHAVDQVHPGAHSESMLGLPTPALTCARWGMHLQDNFPDRGGQGRKGL